jgi:hypothetical protein
MLRLCLGRNPLVRWSTIALHGKRQRDNGGEGRCRTAPVRRKEQSGPVELGSCGGTSHGKEGVDGSSPSEGSAKAPHVALSFDRVAPRPACGGCEAWNGAFASKSPLSTRAFGTKRSSGYRGVRCADEPPQRPPPGDRRRHRRCPRRRAGRRRGPGDCEPCDGECPAAHGSTMTARPVGANHPEPECNCVTNKRSGSARTAR